MTAEGEGPPEVSRRPPLIETTFRWMLIGLFLTAGVVAILWAIHDPSYPVLVSPSGGQFRIIESHHVLSPAGHWGEVNYLAPTDSTQGDEAAARDLISLAGPLAEHNGDSIVYIIAVHRHAHLGRIWHLDILHAIRFERRGAAWVLCRRS